MLQLTNPTSYLDLEKNDEFDAALEHGADVRAYREVCEKAE